MSGSWQNDLIEGENHALSTNPQKNSTNSVKSSPKSRSNGLTFMIEQTILMQKVTGVGGVFFKARDPQALMDWYEKHLGLKFQHGFIELKWADEKGNKTPGSTTIAIFKEDSAHFKPSEKSYMINLRVADLRALLAELQENGVAPLGEIEEYDFGRFGRIMDPEGNKIELWEPVDDAP
jgi:predicted enzyme related to lactoylglutathione lyase